jgi:hypothetical protein
MNDIEKGISQLCDEVSRLRDVNAELLGVAKVAIDHIAMMYAGIARGDAVAGQNFANKDPVVKVLREIVAKAEDRS